MKDQKTAIGKKIAIVQNEMATSKTKVGYLEEKVDGLQSVSQKQLQLMKEIDEKINRITADTTVTAPGDKSGGGDGGSLGSFGDPLSKKLSEGLRIGAMKQADGSGA